MEISLVDFDNLLQDLRLSKENLDDLDKWYHELRSSIIEDIKTAENHLESSK